MTAPDNGGGEISRETWKWIVLAGMASYLDAGSIVALGAGLALWHLALALSSLDLLGIRIVFAHLFVVAMLTWWLRRGLTESRRWTAAAEDDSAPAAAGAVMQVAAFTLFLVLPFTTPVAMANIVLFGIGAALAGEAF